MKRIARVGAVVLLTLAGCSSLPGLTPRQSEWIQGDLPKEEPGARLPEYRFRGMVRQWLHANEIDPAQCKFDWERGPSWYANERYGLAVWMRAVHVNAKDVTGRYTGYRPYIFVVRDGRVVDIIGATVTPLSMR